MRTFSSLALAIVGVFFYSDAVDELAGALTHARHSASFPEAGIWSIIFACIAGIAFFYALRMRGAIWALVLPCGMAMASMSFLNLFVPDTQLRVGTAAMLGLAVVLAILGSLRTNPNAATARAATAAADP